MTPEESIKKMEEFRDHAIQVKEDPEQGNYIAVVEVAEYHPFKQEGNVIATPCDAIISRMDKEIMRLQRRIDAGEFDEEN
jgi:hypothetical protein